MFLHFAINNSVSFTYNFDHLQNKNFIYLSVYRRVKLTGVASKNITRPKSGSHFVGQKRNKINRFSPIYQYSNHAVFENEEQLFNIDIEHIRQF